MKYSMFQVRPSQTAFTAGEEVVLVDGPYESTPGVFLGLGKDANWADIRERKGVIRRHPVAWLGHVPHCQPQLWKREAPNVLAGRGGAWSA